MSNGQIDIGTLKTSLAQVDDKLRELQTETTDYALDVAHRVRSLRDHIADVRDQLKTETKGMKDDG